MCFYLQLFFQLFTKVGTRQILLCLLIFRGTSPGALSMGQVAVGHL